jgi:hypothetical protein
MTISDHITRVPKMRVTVNMVDMTSGELDVIGHDGQVRRVSITSSTAAFRWPIEGEEWMIEEQNGQWVLGDHIHSAAPVEDQILDRTRLEPGDIAVDIGLGNEIVTALFVFEAPPALPDVTIKHTIPRKYNEIIGDGTSSIFFVNHLLGTRSVTFSIVENLVDAAQPVFGDVVTEVHPDYLKLEFAAPPVVNEFLVTVIG